MSNNIIKFADPRKSLEEIREQACAWLARLDSGASAEDMAQLTRWMQEDRMHARMLFNMAAMWDQSAILTELSEIFPLEEKSVSLRARHRRSSMSVAFAAFACLALFAGVFLGLRNLDSWGPSYILDEAYQTAVGVRQQVNLADGSFATLNTNTKIQFSFNRRERTVFLEHGEAFFTVARDAKRPFRVYAGSRVVEAVGTAFTVQHIAGKDLEVIVTEGKVNFLELAPQNNGPNSADGAPRQTIERDAVIGNTIPLIAGERLTIAQDEQQIARDLLQPDEVEVEMAWRVGMLVFRGDSLETVLQEVSRYTTVRLEAEESIRGIQIEGLFRAGDIDGLLIAMEKNFNLDSQRIGEGQILFTAHAEEE